MADKKIRLEIVGLSYSQTQTGAYALVLGEVKGQRRLPIIIGGFEAQAIAIELEKMKPSRPLTHDLFKSFADKFEISVKEVIIYNLVEGIFYAKLICKHNGQTEEIDTRTSDAIAIAVRFQCPVYTYEFILGSAGIILEEQKEGDESIETEEEVSIDISELTGVGPEDLSELSEEQLKEILNRAIVDENYEEASRIRDELKKRKQSD